jgi:hypothetical protein
MTSTISSPTTRTMDNETSPTPGNGQELRLLWLSLLAGPILYMVYFFAGYMLAEAACQLEFWQRSLFGLPGWVAVEMGLTMVTIALIILAGNQALRYWRATHHTPAENGTGQFLAFGGLFLAPLFIYITLITGIFMIVLQPCSWV